MVTYPNKCKNSQFHLQSNKYILKQWAIIPITIKSGNSKSTRGKSESLSLSHAAAKKPDTLLLENNVTK